MTSQSTTTLHYCHDKGPIDWKEDYYQVLGIDPAIKRNLCWWIKRRYVLTGKTVKVAAHHTAFDKLPTGVTSHAWITKYFDQFYNLINECHIMLVERQQVVASRKGMLIGQTILVYLLTRYRNNRLRSLIYEVDPKLKTSIFGGPSGEHVKLWTKHFVFDLLGAKQDTDSLNTMWSFPRPQDSCDVIAMIEAFFYEHKLPTCLRDEVVKFLSQEAYKKLAADEARKGNEGSDEKKAEGSGSSSTSLSAGKKAKKKVKKTKKTKK